MSGPLRVPFGAMPIISGSVTPDAPVLVSLVGELPESNVVVQASPRHPPKRYRWDWAHGLDIVIVFAPRDRQAMVDYAYHLSAHDPSSLWTWSTAQKGAELYRERRPEWWPVIGDCIDWHIVREKGLRVRPMGPSESADWMGLGRTTTGGERDGRNPHA